MNRRIFFSHYRIIGNKTRDNNRPKDSKQVQEWYWYDRYRRTGVSISFQEDFYRGRIARPEDGSAVAVCRECCERDFSLFAFQ